MAFFPTKIVITLNDRNYSAFHLWMAVLGFKLRLPRYKVMYVMCVGSQSAFAGYYTGCLAMFVGSLAVTTSVILLECPVYTFNRVGNRALIPGWGKKFFSSTCDF
jgi:hypothetical protein